MYHIYVLLLTLTLSLPSTALLAQTFERINTGPIATDSTNTNGCSFVDYDADGDLDLFLSNANAPLGHNNLYRNDGGTFVPVTTGELVNIQSISFGHSWGDYNNDGLIDVLVVNAFTMGSTLYRNMGGGRFIRNIGFDHAREQPFGFNADWADIDNDGLLDVVIAHPANFVGNPSTSNILYRNSGVQSGLSIVFQKQIHTPISQGNAPYTNASFMDYDRDGDTDLFIGTGPADGTFKPDYLYQNQLVETGQLQFSRISRAPIATDSLDGQTWNWIDYDNDGDLDAYVTNWAGATGGKVNYLYRRDDDTTFTRITEGPLVEDKGVSLANVWADFDNDGWLDCYVANGAAPGSPLAKNVLYHNNGDGTFSHATDTTTATTNQTWSATVGDYDNDGRLDLFVGTKLGYINTFDGTPGRPNHLYHNTTNNGNHWVLISLEGKTANRSAIGAQVYATATIGGKQLTQYREVGGNANFLGDNSLRVHFGLGKASTITQLRVVWPGGQEQTFNQVKADKIYHLVQGEGLHE